MPACGQSVADLDQGRGQRARVAGHVAGEAVGIILTAAAEPEDDILARDVEDIRPDRYGDPVGVVFTAAARLQGRAIEEVEQERHKLDDRHEQHVPVLAVADLVGDDALDLFRLEQVEDALGDHDPHIVGMMPVGKGVGCTIVDQPEPGHLHVLLAGHPRHEIAEVIRELVDRDPRKLVDPPQRQVHEPRAQDELQDDDPHADSRPPSSPRSQSNCASVIKIRPRSPYRSTTTPAERMARFGKGSIPEPGPGSAGGLVRHGLGVSGSILAPASGSSRACEPKSSVSS